MATKKPYDVPENDSSRVEEPALTYQTDLEMLQREAADLVMQIKNPTILQEVISELTYQAATSLHGSSPIQFTLEELKEQLAITEEQFRQGLWVSHEEMLKKEPQWRKKR